MNIMSRLRIKKSLITVVLHSSNVFAIAKTRHQQMYTDVHLLMRYLHHLFSKGLHCRTATDGGGSMQQRCFGFAETRH